MNILYISSKKSWRGVVAWMHKTALSLQNRGHKIWILTHKNSVLAHKADKSLNIIKKNLGPEYNIAIIIQLIHFIKSNNVDLVLTNIEKEIGIGGIAAKTCKIPNIRRIGREDDFFKRFKTKFNHQFLVSHSIVPCDYVSKQIKQNNSWIDDKKITTIYNGRNPFIASTEEIETEKKRLNIPKSQKIIGVTCHLHKVKYVNHIIEAFKNIQPLFPDWILVITGEGLEKENLEKLVRKYSLESTVYFAGFSTNPMLTSSIYDIAVLTSKIEGFSNSIVEYFAVGKPVIATDVGGANEIITDGVNGFLIPFGDIEKLEKKLLELIKNRDLRIKFSCNARRTLQEKFTEDIMINKIENFFLGQIR